MIKAPKTDTDFRIAFAQSWNLAVEIVGAAIGHDRNMLEASDVKKRLEYWQKYFYQKLCTDLVEAELQENLKKLNSDPVDKIQKHKADFVEDLTG